MNATPPTPFRLPGYVLILAFLPLAAGMCLDFQFLNFDFNLERLHFYFSLGVLGALVLADREGNFRDRAIFALAGVGASILLAIFFWAVAGEVTFARLGRYLRREEAIYIWLGTLWLASPIILDSKGKTYAAAVRWAVLALLAYAALCFASAAAGENAKDSLSDFARERAAAFAVLIAWLRASCAAPQLRSSVGRCVFLFLALLMALSLAAAALHHFGSNSARTWLEANRFVLDEFPDPPHEPPGYPRFRLIFPMQHYNRTAYLALVAFAASALAYLAGRGKSEIKGFAAVAMLLSLAVMSLSYTRGVTAAAGVGILLWTAVRRPRALAVLAVLGVVALLLMPASRREYLSTILRPSTYRPEPGKMTSMKDRMLAWQFGFKTIAGHPIAGLGYGSQAIKKAYETHALENGPPELQEQMKQGRITQHLHNIWLEIAAESGLPALLAFAAFMLFRWIALARRWRAAPPEDLDRLAAWLAIEISVLVCAMIFYMLRRNFGWLTWGVWLYGLAEWTGKREPEETPAERNSAS